MTDLDAIVRLVPFSAHLGFTLSECGPARVVTEVVLKPEHCTAGGTAHGGFLMTLADFTGAAGAYQVLPDGAKGATTIESKTNMLGAAPIGARLRAIATPVHVGKRTSVWTTRVETEEGKLISLTTQTQMAL
jgi:1,4-dihydroxy-2-naphthoyl-CoA hydrolase